MQAVKCVFLASFMSIVAADGGGKAKRKWCNTTVHGLAGDYAYEACGSKLLHEARRPQTRVQATQMHFRANRACDLVLHCSFGEPDVVVEHPS